MRKVLRSVLLGVGMLLTVLPASARGPQPIQFGIKGGVQSQAVRMDKDSGLGVLSADNDFGFQLGLMSRISFPVFFVQPEIVYSWHRFKTQAGNQTTFKSSITHIEVPVLLGLKALFVRFYAGPVFCLSNSTNVTQSRSAPRAVNADMRRSTVSYQLGVGVEFGQFNIDMRYGGQFKKAEQYISIGEGMARTVKTRLNQW